MESATEYKFPRDIERQPFPFEFTVEQTQSKPDIWQARTPYRQIAWCGETRDEAIGMMIRGFAELGRKGSLDPAYPHRIGMPPLQHALGILTEALAYSVDRRREKIEFHNDRQSKPQADPAYDQLDPHDFGRINEIISGLSTSIAALARVKEL